VPPSLLPIRGDTNRGISANNKDANSTALTYINPIAADTGLVANAPRGIGAGLQAYEWKGTVLKSK